MIRIIHKIMLNKLIDWFKSIISNLTLNKNRIKGSTKNLRLLIKINRNLK